MKIAIVSGFWGQNIGNAFFNIGGKWILEQIFPNSTVQFIQDQPAYRTFYNQSKGSPKNYARLLDRIDADYVVLQGPMLTSTFRAIWEKTFKVYKNRGTQVILLSAAFFKYTTREIERVKSFLEEYPPAIISTRDDRTYKIVKDWVPFTYNGIDSAFFVPKAFSPLKFVDQYLTFNFDRYPEPSISVSKPLDHRPDITFSLFEKKWHLTIPKAQQYFSARGKAMAYLGHLLDGRRLPSHVLDYRIIRPEHRYTPHMTHKIYQHPNSFVSDEVFTYFSIYAGTRLTLSDRIHACILTLAYGNPAMLFTSSPRQSLFSRIGLEHIRLKPVTLDLRYLETERQQQLAYLSDAVEKL